MSSDIVNYCKSKFFRGWKGNSEWILEAGEALVEAKETLTPEAYEDLELLELDLETRTGQRLRKIGADDRLRDPAIKDKLPHSYAAMEKLSSLSDTNAHSQKIGHLESESSATCGKVLEQWLF